MSAGERTNPLGDLPLPGHGRPAVSAARRRPYSGCGGGHPPATKTTFELRASQSVPDSLSQRIAMSSGTSASLVRPGIGTGVGVGETSLRRCRCQLRQRDCLFLEMEMIMAESIDVLAQRKSDTDVRQRRPDDHRGAPCGPIGFFVRISPPSALDVVERPCQQLVV
ncbi:hypothetical protein ACG7TL_005867 [Trametes sanguinea]